MQMNEIKKSEEDLNNFINHEEDQINCIDQKYKNQNDKDQLD